MLKTISYNPKKNFTALFLTVPVLAGGWQESAPLPDLGTDEVKEKILIRGFVNIIFDRMVTFNFHRFEYIRITSLEALKKHSLCLISFLNTKSF